MVRGSANWRVRISEKPVLDRQSAEIRPGIKPGGLGKSASQSKKADEYKPKHLYFRAWRTKNSSKPFHSLSLTNLFK